ncbi:MAG: hypothetical protein M4579_005583 [Chaenotheca gracillima]|nr:MAG: hypothetical protein M4579_005583 [Chaenotheca gracillima]
MSSRQGPYQYGQCESYFVEPEHEPVIHNAPRFFSLNQVRATPEERQRALAAQISTQTTDEFLDDIMRHMDTMEGETMPDVASIEIQSEIKWFMRPYLLDFLIEAHASFRLLPETLYLAINLLDRYCSRRIVYKRHYQLVGCAALLIAAKYGDVKEAIPTVRELRTMCCALYDDDMFIQMEWHVLQTLDWAIGAPTVDAYVKIALIESPADPQVEHMALYISELALFSKDFVSIRPSVMARASLALSRYILNRPQPDMDAWSADYDSFLMVSLSQHLHEPSQIVSRKYASQHLSSVSLVMQEYLDRQNYVNHNYAPPTPPSDMSQRQDPRLLTPQKGNNSAMHHGVPTPPITPDGVHFGGVDMKNYPLAGDRPTTPCPMPVGIDTHQQGYTYNM